MVDPLEPVVVTIGKISGGYMGTAIAPEVEMTGTIRTLSRELRERMPGLVEQVVSGVCASFGAGYELKFGPGYPLVINDPDMVDLMTATSEQVYGSKVWNYIKPSTGGEDFAFYCEHIPGCFSGWGRETARSGRGTRCTIRCSTWTKRLCLME